MRTGPTSSRTAASSRSRGGSGRGESRVRWSVRSTRRRARRVADRARRGCTRSLPRSSLLPPGRPPSDSRHLPAAPAFSIARGALTVLDVGQEGQAAHRPGGDRARDHRGGLGVPKLGEGRDGAVQHGRKARPNVADEYARSGQRRATTRVLLRRKGKRRTETDDLGYRGRGRAACSPLVWRHPGRWC